jgi:hypothetical protein
VTDLLKRLGLAVLSPLLRWLSDRFEQVQSRLDSIVAGQEELTRMNRHALVERDAGLDVVSRAVGVQAATLESIRIEQQRLAAEVRALRDELRTLESARDHAVD